MKTVWGVLLGVMFATPIYSELTIIREVRQAGTAPNKKYYTASNGNLSLMDFGVRALSTLQATGNADLQMNATPALDSTSEIIATVTKKPLNYPNPFRKADGTTLYYSLSKTMDVEIRIYDMLANEVFKVVRNGGLTGASAGPNRISLNDLGLDAHNLSTGAYFYLIMNNGKIMAKGKMAIIP